MFDYLNANGLVNGEIPEGQPCPFASECAMCHHRCPTAERPRPFNFSCGLARFYSMGKKPKDL